MSTLKVNALILRADPADARVLAELGARTFTDTFLADNRAVDIASHVAATYSVAKQTEELRDPRTTFFIADIGGVAAGYAMLHAGPAPASVPQDRPMELARLYAAKEWLGRGVGELLMARCIEHARATAHRTFWLGVWERNPRAIRFYEKWELRRVGQHIFRVGADPQNDILMARSL